MNITATVQNTELHYLLNQVSRRYGNLKPVFRDIGEEMIKRVDNRFTSETDPDGNKWQPTKVLSNYLGYVGTKKGYKRKAAYKKNGGWRVAFGRYLANKKILQLTGALRGDIHYQHDDQQVEWGISGRIPYAAIHQFGGMAGRGRKVRIPARPYLGRNTGSGMELASADRQAALEIIIRHLAHVVQ
ncbi:MAG: phage virion morphogenesis protein [Desulfuromonadaceae bacterium]|nr:phage virion morphogenesis protein [Desulfuromonadaceae bacterium]MDD2855332.1 phage virion morphogenesis protein [Desulfuromonadaceae bacterium]